MTNIYTEYYICFNNAEGSFPQRDSSSKNREEVVKEVDKLNWMDSLSILNPASL